MLKVKSIWKQFKIFALALLALGLLAGSAFIQAEFPRTKFYPLKIEAADLKVTEMSCDTVLVLAVKYVGEQVLEFNSIENAQLPPLARRPGYSSLIIPHRETWFDFNVALNDGKVGNFRLVAGPWFVLLIPTDVNVEACKYTELYVPKGFPLQFPAFMPDVRHDILKLHKALTQAENCIKQGLSLGEVKILELVKMADLALEKRALELRKNPKRSI